MISLLVRKACLSCLSEENEPSVLHLSDPRPDGGPTTSKGRNDSLAPCRGKVNECPTEKLHCIRYEGDEYILGKARE